MIKNKLNGLQAVRALAFLAIFFVHCGIDWMAGLGTLGVSVFFVLSGFVMTYSYWEKELGTSIKECVEFSKKKIKKLYPLHIIMLLFSVIFIAKAFTSKYWILCVIQIICNVALIQTWIPSSLIYSSLNGVAWYLSVCTLLYAVFPVIIKRIRKYDCKKALIIAIIIFGGQIIVGALTTNLNIPVGIINEFSLWFTYYFPIFRLGDFTIGCCIYCVFLNKGSSLKQYALYGEILVLVGIVITCYIFTNRIGIIGDAEWIRHTMLFTPISACLVLYSAINKGIVSKLLTCKLLIYIGDLSAYTFLIHYVVIRYIKTISLKYLGINIDIMILTITALIITIIGAEIYKRIANKLKTII